MHHDYLVYEGGKWAKHGSSEVGSVPDGLYGDRLTFHVDDGAVRGFASQGCWVTCHSDLRDPFMYAAPSSSEVQGNSYFNDVINKTDTRKYIPDSRQRDSWWDFGWDDISAQDADVIQALKDGGVFLDQWHRRAARGNPIGVSDDMWVLDYRNGDGGKSAYSTNWDGDVEQPKQMFDPEKTGFAALNFDDVHNGRVPFDSIYYLSDDTMTEFDLNHAWQEGDAIPRRYLRTPEGSWSDIAADAAWSNGEWTVALSRLLDTGNSGDKAFRDRATCDLAFALYTSATGIRSTTSRSRRSLGLANPPTSSPGGSKASSPTGHRSPP
ncbi:MAG: ethylbenzene dehydrogenase-related protein [SAR202 cluster bacterium]|nr:ethylbenzene dehydrogenase-related protein [SAR202 cluster bacterium]